MVENIHEKPLTVINQDVIIKGEVTFGGPTRISGQIEGLIRANDMLEITEDARIFGDIYGTLIDLQGTVKGNVTAAEACRLSPTAKLTGELRSANLAIAEGATFVGKVYVGTELPAAPAPAETASEATANAAVYAKSEKIEELSEELSETASAFNRNGNGDGPIRTIPTAADKLMSRPAARIVKTH